MHLGLATLLFVGIGHEIISTTILSLLLIQLGQLSIIGKRKCTRSPKPVKEKHDSKVNRPAPHGLNSADWTVETSNKQNCFLTFKLGAMGHNCFLTFSAWGYGTELFSFSAWGYGFLLVTAINLCSLGGLIVLPFIHHALYKKILIYMIALAVGTLAGSSLLFLIPEVWNSNLNQFNLVTKFYLLLK